MVFGIEEVVDSRGAVTVVGLVLAQVLLGRDDVAAGDIDLPVGLHEGVPCMLNV